MRKQGTLLRVLLFLGIALGITLLLLPILSGAFRRNIQAIQVTQSLANATFPKSVCEITAANTPPGETGCDDPRTCYLKQARGNLAGQWSGQTFETGTDLLSAYQAGYAAWCSNAPQQAIAYWTPYQSKIADHFAATGYAALSGSDADAALGWFEVGEKLEPSATFSSGSGQAYHARGDLERALTEFDAALTQSPNDVSTLRHAANTAMDARQFARAQAYCERVVALEPNDWLLWQVLGNALGAQKLWAQAGQAYSRVVELNPAYSHGNAGLGIALAQQGRFDQARPFFMNVLLYEQSDRQKGGYMAAFAELLANSGDHRGAVEFYRRASDLDPQNGGFAGEILKQFVLARDCVGMTEWIQARRAKGFVGAQDPVCTP